MVNNCQLLDISFYFRLLFDVQFHWSNLQLICSNLPLNWPQFHFDRLEFLFVPPIPLVIDLPLLLQPKEIKKVYFFFLWVLFNPHVGYISNCVYFLVWEPSLKLVYIMCRAYKVWNTEKEKMQSFTIRCKYFQT